MTQGPWDEDGHLPLPTPEQLRRLAMGTTEDRLDAKIDTPHKEYPIQKMVGLPNNKGRKHGPKRPVARAEDRRYVAGALRHWRKIHGLNRSEAASRIGYSPTSNVWQRWEQGATAPSYEALLRIISATGLGFLQGMDRRSELDPNVRLELDRREAEKHKRQGPRT